MSVGNGPASFGEPDTGSGKTEAAKQEASAVKDTAAGAAKDVAHTAKDEAASVAAEAKSQLKDLYSQTSTELSGQASQQQERLATGLKAVGDELGAMARNSDGGGIATDLVQQVSTRLADAATWLGDRDPAALLDEVKKFARRRPVVFIAGAAIAGIVAGRLVRAMAANQHDDAEPSSPATTAAPVTPALPAPVTTVAPTTPLAGTARSQAPVSGAAPAAPFDGTERRVADERRDTF